MTDGADGASLERPKVFGDYYLLATLARGGMGSIYLAKRVGFSPDIQRFFAVKKLRRGHANARELRRFHDEARVVVTLSHRAICHVFDVGVVDDEHYLAMELVEGVNLHKALGAMKLDAPLALYVIDEVLDALDYAHHQRDPATGQALQIVHRDVSPHNVMLSFQGGVKLIDFGLVSSTLKQEETAGGVVVGKLEYMSPEQARGEPLDARADVYAAGVILFEMLSGRRFYAGLSRGALTTALVDGSHAPSYDGIDAALVPALQRALAPERADRTSSCAALQAELASAGRRASSRELRDALQTSLPDEQARLAALMRSFAGVGVDPSSTPREAPEDRATQVTHIARSSEDEPALTSTHARITSTTSVTSMTTLASGAADISNDPTRISTRVAPLPSPVAPVATRRPASRGAPLALAVAALSGAAVLVVWLAVRGGPDEVAAVDAGALAASSVSDDRPARPVDAVALDAGAVGLAIDDGPIEDDEGDVEPSDPTPSTTRPTRKPRPRPSARPPRTALPDLGAHFDYLARWCKDVSCARPVLAARSRVPLLDVVGLRALRRDAEACVIECRR